MKRVPLNASPDKVREFQQRARLQSTHKRRPVSPASPAQRAAVKGQPCIVCGDSPCDPAHLLPRSVCPTGADDARATIPLCREHHRLYDLGELSLLEYLEPRYRLELAFAVERHGLLATLQRVTNARWAPESALYEGWTP